MVGHTLGTVQVNWLDTVLFCTLYLLALCVTLLQGVLSHFRSCLCSLLPHLQQVACMTKAHAVRSQHSSHTTASPQASHGPQDS